MTQNQIAYHNAQELKRHNQASEAETNRHQQVEEKIKQRSNELAEQSNTITREHYERMDAINARHYENQDAYNSAYLAEMQRANEAGEMIRSAQNAINAAAVSETARHQLIMEGIESSLAASTIRKTAAEISAMSPNADYTRARTAQMWNQSALTQAQAANQGTANTFQVREIGAGLDLTKARTVESREKAFLNLSQGISTLSDMILSWFGKVGVSMR